MEPVHHLVDLLLGQQPRIVDVDVATPAPSHVREAIEA